MVAMAIFAVLAVAGWQVFDSVNRARERAQYHADQLAVLQYAYLQLQQDMGQIIAYQAPVSQNATDSNDNSNNKTASVAEPFMSLDSERVSFIRFADPDPRYQSSTSLQRVEYIFSDQRLIRRQYNSLQSSDSISLDSVLLEGVTEGRWQAYLSEMSAKFPNKDTQNSNNNIASKEDVVLLPKGVGVSFTYQDNPITWQWAMAPQAIPNKRNVNKTDNNPTNNNNPDNNNSNKGNNEGSNSENNADLNNNPENTPNGQ
ncbi:type II secretion system protein GspJ [Psychrobacter urativorans]|uniref:Type II secretion system protein GspJ n=2 Tax=Psychrobacter urativorans TaxID=45610 RepID=A0A0M3V9C6_9GAMM|nr:type II secretion system protein GspJ [Psychrobacter urativorans]